MEFHIFRRIPISHEMKCFSLSAFVLFFCLCFFSKSLYGQSAEFKLIQRDFPDYGFSIAVPEGWYSLIGDKAAKMTKNKIFKALHRIPGDVVNAAAVSISYYHVDVTMPADSIFKQYESKLLASVPFEVYNIRHVDGRPARSHRYTYASGVLPFTSISTFFIDGDILFWFIATTTPGEIETYRKVFDDMVVSIRIGNLNREKFKKEDSVEKN